RAALRPYAGQVAAALLDKVAAEPGVVTDLLAAYARPLPIAVLSELLAIPAADRGWLAAAVAAYDDPARHARVERELAGYFTALVAGRRAGPGDDLVSALARARDDGSDDSDDSSGRLTGPELIATVYLLVMAGFDTTV